MKLIIIFLLILASNIPMVSSEVDLMEIAEQSEFQNILGFENLKNESQADQFNFNAKAGDEKYFNFSRFKQEGESYFLNPVLIDDGFIHEIPFYEGMLSTIKICEIIPVEHHEFIFTSYSYHNNGKYTFCETNIIEIFQISSNETETEEYFANKIPQFRRDSSVTFDNELIYVEVQKPDFYSFKIFNKSNGWIQYYIDFRFGANGEIRTEFEYYDIQLYDYPLPKLFTLPTMYNQNLSETEINANSEKSVPLNQPNDIFVDFFVVSYILQNFYLLIVFFSVSYMATNKKFFFKK